MNYTVEQLCERHPKFAPALRKLASRGSLPVAETRGGEALYDAHVLKAARISMVEDHLSSTRGCVHRGPGAAAQYREAAAEIGI